MKRMSPRLSGFLPKSCLALICILLPGLCLLTVLPDTPTAIQADTTNGREQAPAAPQPGLPLNPPDQRSEQASAVDRIIRLNMEVISLYRQGNFEEALARCTETCELARRELGEEHPEFASCINNLASIYEVRGEYGQAEPHFKQSLEISKKVHGENDPDFALALNNLANLYAETGRYAEAEPLYLRAMEIIRAGAGEDNTFFVKSLNNLASLYKRMGNYVEVEPLYKKAADILLKISG
ncbi:MAG: tetratricopeptide repeat protein, partial [Syntrophobacteraceae bacterium]